MVGPTLQTSIALQFDNLPVEAVAGAYRPGLRPEHQQHHRQSPSLLQPVSELLATLTWDAHPHGQGGGESFDRCQRLILSDELRALAPFRGKFPSVFAVTLSEASGNRICENDLTNAMR